MKVLFLALLTLPLLFVPASTASPAECYFTPKDIIQYPGKVLPCVESGKFCLLLGQEGICPPNIYCTDFAYYPDELMSPTPDVDRNPGITVVLRGTAFGHDGGRSGFGIMTVAIGTYSQEYCSGDEMVYGALTSITEFYVV